MARYKDMLIISFFAVSCAGAPPKAPAKFAANQSGTTQTTSPTATPSDSSYAASSSATTTTETAEAASTTSTTTNNSATNSTPTPTPTTTPTPGPINIQWIQGLQSGRCLDRNYGQTTPNTQDWLWDCADGEDNQKWILTPSGELQMASDTTYCLTVNGALQQATPVTTALCTGAATQLWAVQDTTGGFGTIKLKSDSTLCLDAFHNSTINGSGIVIGTCNGVDNQSWALNLKGAPAGGAQNLIGKQSNRCLDTDAGQDNAGTQTCIWSCLGPPLIVNQALEYTTSNNLVLFNSAGMCLTVNGTFAQGTPVITAPCNGSAAQKWSVQNTSGGYGTVTLPSASNLCLDVFQNLTADGSLVVIGTCNGGNNQLWKLN